MHITHEQLTALLSYDQQTGEFTWIVDRSTRVRAGTKAGGTNADGYRQIGFNRKYYYAHRLAWLYVYGRNPVSLVDHINGDRQDNRISNLREVTLQQNNYNIKKVRASSGLIGVHWSPRQGKWRANISAKGTIYRLGSFEDKESAHKAYMDAKSKLHT